MAQIHWKTAISADFNTASDWSTGTVPGATDNAILDAKGANYTVTASTSEDVNSIQLASNATLDITSGTFTAGAGTGSGANAGTIIVGDNTTFSVVGGLDNTGSISIASGGNDATTLLIGTKGATLSGGGQVTMSDQPGDRIIGAAAGDILTNVNNTISGSGNLGDGQMTLVNQAAGVIDATGTNYSLTLNTSGETVSNAGLIEATGSAGLGISSTTINDSTGGIISSGTGSHVSLATADIIGGTLTTTGSGVIEAVDRGSVLDGTSSSVTNAGALVINDNEFLTIQGVIVNKTSITVNSSGNDTTALIVGAPGATLTGGGQVVMSDQPGNFFDGAAAADVLTNVNNTISGSGNLGNGQMTLVNQVSGVIDATGTNFSITLDTSGETVTNAGLIEATGSAGLGISSTAINDSTGGVISAGTGSHVSLATADVIGGTLTTTGTGVIETVDRGTVLDGTTSTVTNSGQLDINDNTSMTIQGAITNTKTGALNLDSTGNDATQLIVGTLSATLSGGVITLSDEGGNEIFGTVSGPSGSQVVSTLTNKTTIAGSGNIGEVQMMLTNKGVIDATGGNALVIDTGGGNSAGSNVVTNSGTLEATNPSALSGTGGLVLSNVTISNGSTGVIVANGATTQVNLSTATISGGTLETLKGGVIQTTGRSNVLNGTGATVNNTGTVTIVDNTSLTILGAIDNTGAIDVDSAGNDGTYLVVGATGAVLTGSGHVTLSDQPGNAIYGAVAADVLTNVNNTISGSGRLGAAQLTLVNEAAGVIDATGSNASLQLDTSGETLTNAGLIEATGSAGLGIDSTTINNTGVISAGAGSTVTLATADIVGGTLTTTGTGFIQTGDRGTVLDGTGSILNLAGTMQINDNQSLTIVGTINNTGVIDVATGGNDTTQLVIGAAGAVLTGAGRVTLSDEPGNEIFGAVAADVLTNVNNTISGSGSLGAGQLTLVNEKAGVIDATGTGTSMTLNTNGETVTNAGLIEATGSAGLGISSTTINNSGVISVGVGSHVTLATADIMGGTLTTTGTGFFQTGDRGTVLDGTVSALKLAGTMQINDNQSLTIIGTIDNTGVIGVESGGNDTTQLIIGAAGATLTGGGSVILTDNFGNEILGDASTDVLVNVNNTISGSGSFGAGQLTLINQSAGVIDATGAANSMTLDTNGETVVNSGLIEATGSAGLGIVATAINGSTGGVISVGNGSHISLQSADIIGGTLSTMGSGLFEAVDRGTLFDGTTSVVNVAGVVQINDNESLTIAGTIDNTGQINVDSGGNDATQLIVSSANATLEGNGVVSVNGNTGEEILGAAATSTLTNDGNTLEGSGQLFDGNITFVNGKGGVVDATGTAALVLSTPGETITNAGTLEGTGSGGLVISGAAIAGTGGTIFAGAGSSVTLQTTTLTGGSMSTAATGQITIGNGSTATLDAVTSDAGTIFVDSTGAVTSLIFDKSTTLSGGGVLELSANKNNIVEGSKLTVTLTNVNDTIEGSGKLGDNRMVLVNDAKGTIDADSTVVLTIGTKTNTIINAGLIEATAKGKGVINSTVNNTGTLEANGGTLTINAAVIGAGQAVIKKGTLFFGSSTVSIAEHVAFTSTTGKLELADSQGYTGTISGFSTSGKTSLDLKDVGFVSSTEATFSGTASGGVLTVTDGTHTAHISLAGNYLATTFVSSSDGASGVTVVASTAQAPSTHALVAAMATLGSSLGAVGLSAGAHPAGGGLATLVATPRHTA